MGREVNLFTSEELDMSAFAPIGIDTEIEEEEELGFVPASKVKEKTDPSKEEDKNKIVAEEEEFPEIVGDEEDDEDEGTGSSQTSQPTLYSSLAKVLAEEGVLTSFDPKGTKVETSEDLINVIRETIKQNEYADLTDEQKLYLEAVRTGLPPKQVAQEQSMLQQLEGITFDELENNEELRKQIIISDLLNKGISQEKALKLAQRSIDIGEDVSDATEALVELKAFQKEQLQTKLDTEKAKKLQEAENAKEQLLKFKDAVMNTKEIIPGLKINNKIAEKVFEQAVKPVHQLPNGQVVNAVVKAKLDDPIGFETKLNYLFYITKGFSDFSKIATTQKTKAVQELDDLVKGNTFAPRASQMGGNLDFLPPELAGAFDPAIIDNMK
jgi:hypothetical protein